MFVLCIPWLLLLLFLCSLLFICRKKRFIGCSILIIVYLINVWAKCISYRIWPITEPCGNKNIKVLSFNINGMSEGIQRRVPAIQEIINNNNPDVIFFAEFCEDDIALLDTLLKERYPYTTCGHSRIAHYFYSKYPLGASLQLRDKERDEIGSYYCTLHQGKDSILLYGCHFASNNYTKDRQYITPDSINSHDDLKAYIDDIKLAYEQREHEAEVIIDHLKENNRKAPVIMMGDFNDVSGSSALTILEKAELIDAWWEGGCGYGATIHRPLPYRIDHIMHTGTLKLKKIKVIQSEGASDHDALYAEFSY